MKTSKTTILFSAALALILSATSCTKADNVSPQTGSNNNSSNNNGTNTNTGNHQVNPALAGTWMWTESGDAAYYDANGTYNGSAYGLATQYKINADGSGTCFSHIYTSIGGSTGFEVNISSTGFFESDNQGHLGYFPLSGTYKTSDGTSRALRPDELWDVQTNKGSCTLYQKLVITTQGNRQCFQVTSSDSVTDTFFNIP